MAFVFCWFKLKDSSMVMGGDVRGKGYICGSIEALEPSGIGGRGDHKTLEAPGA